MTKLTQHTIWFGLSSKEDILMIQDWLEENTADNFHWYFVPGSSRRRVEFETLDAANTFRDFLQKEGLVIYE